MLHTRLNGHVKHQDWVVNSASEGIYLKFFMLKTQ